MRINGSIYYLADSALSAIASSCPNLKTFQYKLSWGYSAAKDYLSGRGIVNLCARCRRLEILVLKDARNLTKEHCEEILTMIEEGDEGDFALRKIDLQGYYTFSVKEHPLRVVDKETR